MGFPTTMSEVAPMQWAGRDVGREPECRVGRVIWGARLSGPLSRFGRPAKWSGAALVALPGAVVQGQSGKVWPGRQPASSSLVRAGGPDGSFCQPGASQEPAICFLPSGLGRIICAHFR